MPIKVSFQDEARFGRISDPTRAWAMPGVRPITLSQIIREYTYAYGAFFPDDGESITMILPFMDSFCMNLFLKEVSQSHPHHLILMVIDGAPNHRSQQYETPSNIRFLYLPPYCPQLNPSENMWDEMREKFFANIHFNSMKELEEHLCQTLIHYESNPQIVKSITNWEWISNEIHSIFIAD
jgi:hypothetical protein